MFDRNIEIYKEIYDYISHIVDIADKDNRKIILWRCAYTGSFVKYLIKNDDYCIFYFYNPFGSNIIIPLIHNIEESVKRVPRDVHILYINPMHHIDVVRDTKFKLVKQYNVDALYPEANVYAL